MTVSQSKRGLMYIAFGQQYDLLAAHAVRYSRKFTNLPVRVITNLRKRSSVWDEIPDVLFTEVDAEQFENRQFKTTAFEYSRFDETLLLDCDSVIQAEGVEKIFDAAGDEDLLLNCLTVWKVGDRIPRIYAETMKRFGFTLPFKVFNGAFILFKRTPQASAFFYLWHDYWKSSGAGRDMPSMNMALQICDATVKETSLSDGFFAPDYPHPECIVQHCYNGAGDKDFHADFGLPRIQECKPFDVRKDDWELIDL